MNTLIAAVAAGGVAHLLVMFLIALIAIVVIAGLIWAVETWIIRSALPNPVRLVIGLIIILIVVIWALNGFGGL